MDGPDGKVGHAELQIGDSVVMLADEFPGMGPPSPTTLGGTPVTLMVYVEDVDETFGRALKAGATQVEPVEDKFYGDRSGQSWTRSDTAGTSPRMSRMCHLRRWAERAAEAIAGG